MKGARVVGVIVVALIVAALPARAQQWNFDAQAGRIRSALDPAAAQTGSVVLGLRFDDASTGLRVSGGVPTASSDPLWGAGAVAKHMATHTGPFLVGVDVTANGFVLHDRVQRTREIPGFFGSRIVPGTSLSGHAIAGQAMPVIGFESARFQAFVRAGVSHYDGTFGDQSRSRTVKLGDAQLIFAPTPNVALIPTVRHYIASDSAYTYAGVTGMVGSGAVNAWATVGQWVNATDAVTPWAVGAALRIHPRATLTMSARQDALDPLYLTPPQTAWNAGVSILLGGRTTPAAPVPAAYVNGRATIRLRASQAPGQPSIAGDFNGWKPQPMQRDRNDWTYTLPLSPGVYNYAFVDEQGEWFVPDKYPGRKDDGMGGHVAVLVVEK